MTQNEYKEHFENKIKAFNEFSIAIDRMIAGEYLDTELEGQNISKELLDVELNRDISKLIFFTICISHFYYLIIKFSFLSIFPKVFLKRQGLYLNTYQ